ncbi:MAG: o-succinylbenzoate synthase [Flavobacteriaceae bacterium]|nr:o-succinylbenzoate synthase [Flavobacteriaceae bacterium]
MKGSYCKYTLNFKRPSGTSRGVLKTKETWFIKLEAQGEIGIGECGLFRGLSIDDCPDYEDKLKWLCENLHLDLEIIYNKLKAFPSIYFGLEMALLSLKGSSPFNLFPSKFTNTQQPIAINGLIWMGDKAFMKAQIAEKINAGFSCLKMKIGALDFETEYDLLKAIRHQFSESDIELRVDANGGFSPDDALQKLERLSKLHLHSIEQPIKQKQWESMAMLCEQTPLPIALDEELIGLIEPEQQKQMLEFIKPQYIILKPSLIGGFKASDQWIKLAEKNAVGWWITSALESNIGLNAIAQYTFTKNSKLPQGLGTGGLFSNNFKSPLVVKNGKLNHVNDQEWDVNLPFY